MKQYYIPLLSEKLSENADTIMASYEVDGIELFYPWPLHKPRSLFTLAFIAAGIDGIAVSFCAEAPKNKLLSKKTSHKMRVFEDDCLEFFIRPEAADIYYGFEFNSKGFLLDYRSGIGEKGKQLILDSIDEKEEKRVQDTDAIISGCSEAKSGDKILFFDYSWKSNALITNDIEDEFWYAELFIPWGDFGLKDFDYTSLDKKTWTFTCNRIDNPGNGIQGYQTLLASSEKVSFHQPELFAKALFQS